MIKYGSIHNQNLTKHSKSTNLPLPLAGEGWGEGLHLEFFKISKRKAPLINPSPIGKACGGGKVFSLHRGAQAPLVRKVLLGVLCVSMTIRLAFGL